MGYRKKIFLLLASAMLAILILSYASIYYYLYHSTYQETLTRQQATITLNEEMADNFLTSIYRTAVQFVSDQTLGENLSTDGEDTLDLLQSRENIRSQFSHYAVHQAIDSSYYYKNTLFLSDNIPISTLFEPYTLDTNPYAASNMVFSNTNVKEEDWFNDTVQNITCAFINEGTDEFCFSRRLNNTYYLGPNLPEGTAVMVVSVSLDQLDQVFGNVSVTDNSGYALLYKGEQLLYCSNKDIPRETYISAVSQFSGESADLLPSTSGSGKYLISHRDIQYGLSFLFLTPESDIIAGIMPIMHTYSLIFFGITIVVLIVIFFVTNEISRPLIRLAQAIGKVDDTRTFDPATLPASRETEIATLERSFEQLIAKTNRLIRDIQIQNENERRSQLKALQAQINPHFIFNAMDMVNWLALSRSCDDIAGIVDSIARLMRYSITDADNMVDISQELKNIQDFVSIYQLRHRSSPELICQVEEGTRIMIPKFTLQPLVENSVRHASPPPGENLKIVIRAYHDRFQCTITVSDNGVNGDAEQLNLHLAHKPNTLKVSSGFGIRNVDERLRLHFKNSSGLTYLNREDGGLTARILLPWTPAGAESSDSLAGETDQRTDKQNISEKGEYYGETDDR